MGVIKLFSSDSYDTPSNEGDSLPNPRPDNYEVIRHKQMGNYLLIEIKYNDCTNYEGRKIMIYRCGYDKLIKQKLIDPHFSENQNYASPIIRLEPTERGWQDGINFIERCG